MWTHRTSSGTQEHPTPADVFRAVLSRMVEKGVESSWAHFEVVAEGGWFENLLRGKQPWVQVAYADRQSLQLNPGVPKKNRAALPQVPIKWRQEGPGLWTVPASDVVELTRWLDTCLASVSGRSTYRVTGWIEGL